MAELTVAAEELRVKVLRGDGCLPPDPDREHLAPAFFRGPVGALDANLDLPSEQNDRAAVLTALQPHLREHVKDPDALAKTDELIEKLLSTELDTPLYRPALLLERLVSSAV